MIIALLQAARLRTLPLALSGIFWGMGIVKTLIPDNNLWHSKGIFCLIIAIFLQILANWANDLGDGIKGVDQNRIGPLRTIAAGKISRENMQKAVIFLSICIEILITYFLFFHLEYQNTHWLFLAMGNAAIWAALRYTWGKNAYGYRGLGDLMVALFFGALSLLGTVFLLIQKFDPVFLLPATGIGGLSVAVLHLNNLRDRHNDKKHGKNTLALILGEKKAKNYHSFLIFTAFVSLESFFYLFSNTAQSFMIFTFLIFIPLFWSSYKVQTHENPQILDRFLPLTALSTFVLSIGYFLFC